MVSSEEKRMILRGLFISAIGGMCARETLARERLVQDAAIIAIEGLQEWIDLEGELEEKIKEGVI